MSRSFAVRERIAQRQVVGTTTTGGVVAHVADGVRRARRIGRVGARVDALLRNAHTILRTVGVDLAFDLLALLERIALQTGRTLAGGSMVVAVAFGAHRARIAQNARIDAVTIVANLIEGALFVRFATNYNGKKRVRRDSSVSCWSVQFSILAVFTFNATNLRIARVSWLTVTHRVVIDDATFSVRTAITRTSALTIDTGHVWSAFRIRNASNGLNIWSCNQKRKVSNGTFGSISKLAPGLIIVPNNCFQFVLIVVLIFRICLTSSAPTTWPREWESPKLTSKIQNGLENLFLIFFNIVVLIYRICLISSAPIP
jgi:hypothetical protein